MKVLICGSREWSDGWAIWDRIKDAWPTDTEILVGDARGADAFAATGAEEAMYEVRVFKANWSTGRSAGIERNLRMLDQCPDLVLAFWVGDSPGTRHTLTEAKKRAIPCEVHWVPNVPRIPPADPRAREVRTPA